jgi:hypothetical protein
MRYQCKVACILNNHYFLSRGIDLFKVFYPWLSWSKQIFTALNYVIWNLKNVMI